jgi:dTDP-4-amino-4,6-dideoxygalactose transaminase
MQSLARTEKRSTFLAFFTPSVSEEDIAAVVRAMKADWLTTGPRTHEFERAFSERLGAAGALGVSSCTAALHAAMAVKSIGCGDEVITTSMTFAATVNVIEHVGARPVLVDVEPDTLNIDPTAVAAAVTPRTRAIIPVHYAGHPVDLEPIEALARRHGLEIIEDAAHALPASYRGRTIGSSGHMTAFSFYATKNITTAEGGMLTGPPDLLEKARVIALHGMSRDAWGRYAKGGSWFYEVVLPGFKYNMTDIEASMGLAQLRKLDSFQQRRREIVAMYNAAFCGEPAFQVPVERPDVEHAWHLYVLRLHLDRLRIGRDRFIDELALRNIGASVHFIPIHLHPYYRDKYGYHPGDFPVAYENFQRMLSLPLHPGLSDDDVQDVVSAVLDVAHSHLV